MHITPWKSLVVKEIEPADRKFWGRILDQYRINVRHASNELNWQLENNCTEGLRLKQELVKQFEEADLRTYKLCFAIKTHLKSGLFGSIIIRKLLDKPNQEQLFEILHTRDFNPNTKEFIVYRTDLQQCDLGDELISLCKHYYGLQIGQELPTSNEIIAEKTPVDIETYFIYQCKSCLTIYDEFWGDELYGISAGTDFETLTTYCCPTCDSPKENFLPLTKPLPVF